MGNKALSTLELYSAAANPTTPTLAAGAIYYYSTLKTLRVYDGSAWVEIINNTNPQTIAGIKTFTQEIITAAATTSIPSIRIPHGTAPSAPTNGDVWTTTAGMYVRINGATVGPLGSSSITYASSADLANVSTTAEDAGVLNNVARGDHKHDILSGTPSVLSGVSTALGSASSLARSDHQHSILLPAADGTNPSTRMPHGTAPAAPTNGDVWTTTAGMYVRINGTTVGPLAAGGGVSYATTSELANVDNAAESAGASALVARGDHKHAVNSATAIALTGAAGAGTSTSLALADHQHGTSGLVLDTGTQTIAGAKTFTSQVTASGTGASFTSLISGGTYTAFLGASSTTTAYSLYTYTDGGGYTFVIRQDGRMMYHDGEDMTTKGHIIVGGTGGARNLAVGANGTTLTADSTAARGVAWVDNMTPVIFSVNGQLGVAAGVSRIGVEGNYTIKGVRARVDTAPTGTSIKVDVNKNGTTLWSTQTNRPDIAVSTNASSYVTNMNTTTLASGDYLTMDVDQIGSTIAGSHLTVTVWLVRTS
jgi:hypothetical protein